MNKPKLFILASIALVGVLVLHIGAKEAKAFCQCISSFMCPPGGGPLDCFWNEQSQWLSCECCDGCGGGACFTGDTPIRMADNTEKPISEVKEGEMVKSFDPATGEITESEVTKVYKHRAEEIKGYYLLTLESGKQIKVTPEHPILVLDEKGERVWKTAEEIVIGDYAFVYDEKGNPITKDEENGIVAGTSDTNLNPKPSPNLLQILFPPLWLFMKMFKN